MENGLTTEPLPSSAPARRRDIIIWSALAGLFALVALVFSFEEAMHFAGSGIDGPFQFYNAMRRIQAGFHPGIDFQFFHGLGIPYSQYWLYHLLGGGLRGAELTRQLVAGSVFVVVYVVIFRAYFAEWATVACLTATALATTYLLRMTAISFAASGMLGVRSALPTVLPALLYLTRHNRRRWMIAGVLMGGALWMSTEQGLAFALAFSIVSSVGVLTSSDRRGSIRATLGTLATAALTLVGLETAIGGFAGMRGALRYNFALVPMDQYWYFGAPPNPFFASWRDLATSLVTRPEFGFTVLGLLALLVLFVRRMFTAADDAHRARYEALALASAYGLIACASTLGVFVMSYTMPARRNLLVIVLVMLADYSIGVDRERHRRRWFGVSRSLAAAAPLTGLYAMLRVPYVSGMLFIGVPHIIRDHVFGDARFSMTGMWPTTLASAQRIVDAHRHADGSPPSLWSTYAGWIEARNGLFNPSFDYIIHPLGPDNRRAYVETFRATKPTLVQTVSPSYTPYEAWIEDNHWPFYDELLRNYRVVGATPWSIFWERRSETLAGPVPVASFVVPPGAKNLTFNIPPALGSVALLDVRVDYATHNPLRRLPIIGMTPRYLLATTGAFRRNSVSFAPYDTTKTFPMVVAGGATVTFSFGTFGLVPGASWEPHRVQIWSRAIDAANEVWLSSLVLSEESRRLEHQ